MGSAGRGYGSGQGRSFTKRGGTRGLLSPRWPHSSKQRSYTTELRGRLCTTAPNGGLGGRRKQRDESQHALGTERGRGDGAISRVCRVCTGGRVTQGQQQEADHGEGKLLLCARLLRSRGCAEQRLRHRGGRPGPQIQVATRSAGCPERALLQCCELHDAVCRHAASAGAWRGARDGALRECSIAAGCPDDAAVLGHAADDTHGCEFTYTSIQLKCGCVRR